MRLDQGGVLVQGYQQFAVYALRDKQPVFTDGSESHVLRTVSRNTRLNVIKRQEAHYIVRVMNQVAYVPVADVTARSRPEPVLGDGIEGVKNVGHTGTDGPRVDYGSFGVVPADFSVRLFSYLIDYVVTCVVAIAVAALFLAVFLKSDNVEDMSSAQMAGLYAAMSIAAFSYLWLMDAVGGTVGKILMGIHLIDDSTGKSPGLRRALKRNLVRIVSAAAFYAGFLWMLKDSQRKTWHDKAAGTSAVRFR